MKIILTENVRKQGNKGDIINVKDGYGNFLIKNNQAVLATSSGINKLNRENKKKEEALEEEIKRCNEIKKNIEKEKISFKVKVGTGDRVFGSVSAKQISEALKKYNIDKKQIKFESQLSSLGFHEVKIELHKKVVATIKVQLVK